MAYDDDDGHGAMDDIISFIHSCIATSIDQSIKIFIDADDDDDDDGFFRISNFIL